MYVENLEQLYAASPEALAASAATASGQAAAVPVPQRRQQRALAQALAAVERIERQHQLPRRWPSDGTEYCQAQADRKAKHLHNLQRGIEGVVVQLQRQHAEDARQQLDMRSRKPLHKRKRQRVAWQKRLSTLLDDLQLWACAPGEPEPGCPGFDPSALSATSTMEAGYQLPWIAQHDEAAAIAADLQQVQQQLQRNREELSIVQREAQDLCTFQQHIVREAQRLGSRAAPPAVMPSPSFLSGATADAVSMWQQRHHAGKLHMLQQREQRAAAVLQQGQAVRDGMVEVLPVVATEGGAGTGAAAVAAAMSVSIGAEDVDAGEADSDVSDDVDILALSLDAIDIEYDE